MADNENQAAQGGRAYTEDDFTHVVDGSTGEVMKHPVPKAWVGTDLLPPGSKKATAKQVKDGDTVSVEDAGQADDVETLDAGSGE